MYEVSKEGQFVLDTKIKHLLLYSFSLGFSTTMGKEN